MVFSKILIADNQDLKLKRERRRGGRASESGRDDLGQLLVATDPTLSNQPEDDDRHGDCSQAGSERQRPSRGIESETERDAGAARESCCREL